MEMPRILTLTLAFLAAMVFSGQNLFTLIETFDVDVEPACRHWFDTPGGFWGFWPAKKFNDFYTFWNTIIYAVYRISMAII